MFDFLNSWYRRYFTDPQAALLAVLLVISFVVVFTMGRDYLKLVCFPIHPSPALRASAFSNTGALSTKAR